MGQNRKASSDKKRFMNGGDREVLREREKLGSAQETVSIINVSPRPRRGRYSFALAQKRMGKRAGKKNRLEKEGGRQTAAAGAGN